MYLESDSLTFDVRHIFENITDDAQELVPWQQNRLILFEIVNKVVENEVSAWNKKRQKKRISPWDICALVYLIVVFKDLKLFICETRLSLSFYLFYEDAFILILEKWLLRVQTDKLNKILVVGGFVKIP